MKFRDYKSVLSAGAALCALATAAPVANAQDSEEAAGSSEERIVVTGTRIARDPNVGAPVPIQSIDADQIRTSGDFNLTDTLNDIPALVASVTTAQSIDSGTFALGTNVLDLRNLGTVRTLTLIDGRRSVAGVEGSAAVDISSIPPALVERVEVLTGGASAIYGADAVTGVVNFILKDDFEGFETTGVAGMSGDGAGQAFSLSSVYGRNFNNDRGNFTFSVSAGRDEGLRYSDQDAVPIGGAASSGGEWANPAFRFQRGEISTSATPNFARFYNFENTGLFPYGLRIPSSDAFIADYTDTFGEAPDLTSAEQALIDRAGTALPRTVIDQPVFSITSGNGFIIPGNPYTFNGFNAINDIDLDGNGVDDCLDSFVGYNSSFSAASFGVLGGCWTVNSDGSLRPLQDGVITGNFNGGGGDSVFDTTNQFVLPPEDRVSISLTSDYDLTPWATVFAEFSGSYSDVEENVEPTSFWDLLFGAPDNPFLPSELQDLAQQTGGIAITADPTYLGDPVDTDERRIFRFVTGFEGDLSDSLSYEVSYTWGEFHRRATNRGRVINDRFFAAIDAVSDPVTGDPTCRSSLDATALPPSTPFGIPVYDDSAFWSFTPGAGSPCVPLNIWAAESGVTQEALDWVTRTEVNDIRIGQQVLSGVVSGDTGNFFSLPAGPIGFAAGAEYREERSKVTYDPFREGIIPEGAANAGQLISNLSDTNASLLFRPNLRFVSTSAQQAQFDVAEIFGEVFVPLLSGVTLAEDLSFDAAVRFSDYSTVGETVTWKFGGSWAPTNDIRFRATLSQAVRAPNIGELFQPDVGVTFRPADPCSVPQIDNANLVDPQIGAFRQANCVAQLTAIGVDPFDENGNYAFLDPLSAAFGGIEGGNPNLTEETADTLTVGFVAQPSFLDGLTLSVDYWSVEIEDAIALVGSQDIVDNCYDSPALNDNFCNLFARNTDPTSAQFGGLSFLRRGPVNFAQFDAAGIDFSGNYGFSYLSNDFDVSVQATKLEKLDLFRDPADTTIIDPELGEYGNPEWVVNAAFDVERGPFGIGWQTQYLSEQLELGVETDELDDLFGPIGVAGNSLIHDLNFRYEHDETIQFFGGINNITEETPFRSAQAYPASPLGRFFFVGATVSLQ